MLLTCNTVHAAQSTAKRTVRKIYKTRILNSFVTYFDKLFQILIITKETYFIVKNLQLFVIFTCAGNIPRDLLGSSLMSYFRQKQNRIQS